MEEEFDGIELRELERIEAPYIPWQFQTLSVDQGDGILFPAETKNFTIKGLRLFMAEPEADFTAGEHLIISPEDNSFKLIGQVVHVFELKNNLIYIGVKILPSRGQKIYKSIIEAAEEIELASKE